MTDEPPWMQCDILNGSALFIIELSTLHLRNRWTIIFPAIMGLLWTCVVYADTAKKPMRCNPPKNLTARPVSIGAIPSVVRTAYSIVELTLLVASITTMLEADHRTWGPMAAIPLLVLGMIRSPKPQTPGLPPGQTEPSIGATPPPPQRVAPPPPGDIFKAAVAHLLRTVVFTDTMANVLAIAAGIAVLFSTGPAASLLTSQLVHRGGDSILTGIASDKDYGSGAANADAGADSPVVAMMLALLLLPSTPVFGGGMDLVFRSGFVRESIPQQQLPIATSVLSAVWYCLLFSLRVATPSVVSWPGTLMLISCSLLLVNSFKVHLSVFPFLPLLPPFHSVLSRPPHFFAKQNECTCRAATAAQRDQLHRETRSRCCAH